jgi:hypothetical protein
MIQEFPPNKLAGRQEFMDSGISQFLNSLIPQYYNFDSFGLGMYITIKKRV